MSSLIANKIKTNMCLVSNKLFVYRLFVILIAQLFARSFKR